MTQRLTIKAGKNHNTAVPFSAMAKEMGPNFIVTHKDNLQADKNQSIPVIETTLIEVFKRKSRNSEEELRSSKVDLEHRPIRV